MSGYYINKNGKLVWDGVFNTYEVDKIWYGRNGELLMI